MRSQYGLLLCLSWSVACQSTLGVEQHESERRFGDDRVGDVLKDATTLPETLAEFETAFGVGRACDNKQIFIVEEESTRLSGETQRTGAILPRVVITGCTPQPYALMAAVISSEDLPTDDPLYMKKVEVMALDRTSLTYNFYVFGPGETLRQDDHCVKCHVNKAPLMNEIQRPWRNWISQNGIIPRKDFTGETRQLLDAASFANELEPIIREGIRQVAEARPIDVNQAMESVFCQTELNFASTLDQMPLELFVDKHAAAPLNQLVAPPADPAHVFPLLLPIRSDFDVRIERVLQKKKYLDPQIVMAIRLLDDQNDVLSETRCAQKPIGLPADPAEAKLAVIAHLQTVDVPMTQAQRAYYDALLSGTITNEKTAYLADLEARTKAAFETDPEVLKARVAERIERARAMFPADAPSPLPILE